MTISFFAARSVRWAVFLSVIFLISVSCSKNDPVPSNADPYVNAWILENMQTWYLWNEEIPSSTSKNKAPDEYFGALLSSQDRFSWIQPNYNDLLNALQGISLEAGFEFALYRQAEGGTNVIAQILYVKPESPAATASLKRGDVISHINNQQINTENYRTLLESMSEPFTIQYRKLNIEEESFDESTTTSLTPIEYHEDPNYFNTIFVEGEHKIGYYIYNFFASGTEDNVSRYDNEMDAVFSHFKSEGITDLILDLRFNSGGSEAAANNLASLIGKNISTSKIFFKREYNDQVTAAILNDPDAGESFLSTRFLSKSDNIGSQLNNGRVYILTSSRTASASELIINALRPYMEVFLIGDVTYGKNVGSISIYEENDPKNTWGMQPIIVKAYNSLDQSNYAEGFSPNVLNEDNDTFLYPLGDKREVLLRDAIGQITGSATTGKVRKAKDPRNLFGHSLDIQPRSYNLIVDVPESIKRLK